MIAGRAARGVHAARVMLMTLTLAVAMAGAACAPRPAPAEPAPADQTRAAPLGELSLAALARSFTGRPPFTVGFDIDDTTLLSSFAFAYADGVFEASGLRYRDDLRYWTLVNDSLDARFSRPKESIKRVIALHIARGDTIVFITGRHTSATPSDRTSRLLMRLLALPAPPRVVFTERAPKTEFIRAVHPAVFYGDADSDIEDARAADPRIRAIRIIRGPCSTSTSASQPGRFGEEVLAGSAY